MRRLFATVGLAALTLVAMAAPAAADPATPTNFESEVLAVTPATQAISIKVVGGDGFLDLHVQRGHTAIVHGYGTSGYAQTTDTGEPWLRITAEGTVQENRNSPATYLNANRYATKIAFPAGFDPDKAPTLEPDWMVVGHGGQYVWHDHRIHWMGKGQTAPLVRGTNQVRLNDRPDGDWIVSLEVDGKPVTVRGRLILHAAPSPIPWLALLAVAAAAAAALGLAIDPVLAGTLGALAAALVGLVAGLEERSVVPTAAGGSPTAWVLPAVAIAVALAAFALRNRATRVIATLASAATIVGWGLLRVTSLWKAVPLSALSAPAAHALLAASIGLAIGGAIAAVRSRALVLTAPADGEPPD